MVFAHFTAGADDDGRRLDRILRRFLNEEQLSSIYKSLRTGLIKVDGKKRKGDFRVSAGSDIQVADFLLGGSAITSSSKTSVTSHTEDSAISSEAEKSPLPHDLIIFKNNAILILNKPYDIPVQPSSSSNGKSLAEIVQADYETTHEKTSLSFRTGPLHRLDRKTTGLIAFSQNLTGARWFGDAIQSHAIQKTYLAILEGNLSEKQIWEDEIVKIENGKRKMENFHTVTVNAESGGSGKFAHTEVEPISHGVFREGGREIAVTLAKIRIKTGRTHQIRSQSAYHGFPMLGDTAYGGTKIDESRWGQSFFLHAAELHFPAENPLGLPETLTAPISAPFRKILENSDFPPYN